MPSSTSPFVNQRLRDVACFPDLANAQFTTIHLFVYEAFEARWPNTAPTSMHFDFEAVDFERSGFQPHDSAFSLFGGNIS